MTTILKYILLLTVLTTGLFAQDTLKFVKSYPLKKTTTSYPTDYSDNDVSFPVEYIKYKNEKTVSYLKTNRCNSLTEFDEEGNQFGISICDSTIIDSVYRQINLTNFVDTIYFEVKNIPQFKPFIKTKNRRYYFSAYDIIGIFHGVMTHYKCKNLPNGELFTIWDTVQYDKEKLEELKKSVFVLKNLYYRKGEANYKLERQFILIFK